MGSVEPSPTHPLSEQHRGNSQKSYYGPVRLGFQTGIRSKLSNRLFAEIERNSENVRFPDSILKLCSEIY